MNKNPTCGLVLFITIIVATILFCASSAILSFEDHYFLILFGAAILSAIVVFGSIGWHLHSSRSRKGTRRGHPSQPSSSSRHSSVSHSLSGDDNILPGGPVDDANRYYVDQYWRRKEEVGWEKTEYRETFEPKTEAQYREEKLIEFHNWQDKVNSEGGIIINTQGRTSSGIEAPQILFMETQKVRLPAVLSTDRRPKEKIVKVKVSCSTFSEIVPRYEGSKEYCHQAIYTIDSRANSVVRAQELLWQLESHKKENGLCIVPVIRWGKPCWLPLEESQFYRWQGDLKATVKSFERHGLTYEKVKNYEERQAFEAGQSSDETLGAESVDSRSRRCR